MRTDTAATTALLVGAAAAAAPPADSASRATASEVGLSTSPAVTQITEGKTPNIPSVDGSESGPGQSNESGEWTAEKMAIVGTGGAFIVLHVGALVGLCHSECVRGRDSRPGSPTADDSAKHHASTAPGDVELGSR